MSRNFFTTAVSQLKIPPRKLPVSLLKPPSVPPGAVATFFNWALDYDASSAIPNVNVVVNVQTGGPQETIDIVRSIKIDNSGNPCPVYVYFIDSTDTIVAPPNSIVRENVITNSKLANVILQGATDGGVGQTTVYFCNFVTDNYVDYEINQSVELALSSPSIALSGGSPLQSIVPTAGGIGYNNGNLVITGGGGVGATAHGIISGPLFSFSSVVIDNPGTGYTGTPIITPTGGGNGAAFFTTLAPPASQPQINSQGYGVPALGDQSENVISTILAAGTFRNNLWGTPYSGGFIYLTSIFVGGIQGGGASTNTWQLETSDGAILYSFKYIVGTLHVQLLNLSNMNVKLDATKTWRLRATLINATIDISHGWSWTYSLK